MKVNVTRNEYENNQYYEYTGPPKKNLSDFTMKLSMLKPDALMSMSGLLKNIYNLNIPYKVRYHSVR